MSSDKCCPLEFNKDMTVKRFLELNIDPMNLRAMILGCDANDTELLSPWFPPSVYENDFVSDYFE